MKTSVYEVGKVAVSKPKETRKKETMKIKVEIKTRGKGVKRNIVLILCLQSFYVTQVPEFSVEFSSSSSIA